MRLATDAYEDAPTGYRSLRPSEAPPKILSMCRPERPLTIGEAAMQLGFRWSLEETEKLFLRMESEGLIRRLSEDEQRLHATPLKFYRVK